jgi:hypothetical protein
MIARRIRQRRGRDSPFAGGEVLDEWLQRARLFRRRVEELRAVAEAIADPDTRSGVLAAAEIYARFADEIGET